MLSFFFFFSSRRRHTRCSRDWSSDVCSSDLTSLAVLAAQGSVLTNKYSEGYPGKRYYGGNYVVDDAEELARDRACALFGTDHANVQPHSGASANMAAYMALLEPGDKLMGMRLDQGGHLTHGSPVNFSGRFFQFVSYGVTDSDERLDYDQMADLAAQERPKAIIAGATAYPRTWDPEALRRICDDPGPRRSPRPRGLPPRARRHRQPPEARRPASVRSGPDRQPGPPRARPCGHHPQREHRAQRPSAAVPGQRRPHRHGRGDHRRDG